MMGGTLEVSFTAEGAMNVDILPDYTLSYYDDGSYRDADNTMLFKLVEEENGGTYFYQMTYSPIPGFPPLATSSYAAEKLPENETSNEVWTAWERIDGQVFLMLNEVYSSQIYLRQPMTTIPVQRNSYGYIYGLKIVDEFTLMPVTNIPGTGSRDYQSLTVSRSDGKTYLSAGGYLMMSSSDLVDIHVGKGARCTIQADGYARWYSIGAAAGKTMSITSPETSNFYVYDTEGSVIGSSIFGLSTVTLPEDGYIAFIGDIGDRFVIDIA